MVICVHNKAMNVNLHIRAPESEGGGSRGTEIDGQKWSERMLLYITQYRLHPFVEHMGVR